MDEHSALAQLLKPIYLEDAPCKGLKAAFGLPPDCNDYIDYFCSVCLARLAKSAAQLGLSIADPRFHERIGIELLRRKPNIGKSSNQWSHIILEALLTTIRPPGSRKTGRPRDSHKLFAETYADIEFLNRKIKLSVRNISSRLNKMKGYKERYGTHSASALRKKYQQAVKLKDKDWKFRVFLFGPEALMAANKTNSVATAMERHSLKI